MSGVNETARTCLRQQAVNATPSWKAGIPCGNRGGSALRHHAAGEPTGPSGDGFGSAQVLRKRRAIPSKTAAASFRRARGTTRCLVSFPARDRQAGRTRVPDHTSSAAGPIHGPITPQTAGQRRISVPTWLPGLAGNSTPFSNFPDCLVCATYAPACVTSRNYSRGMTAPRQPEWSTAAITVPSNARPGSL
jgi:hypothetical protein